MEESGVSNSKSMNGGQESGIFYQLGHQLICRMIEVFENPKRLRSFFSFTGGSILYCLSALSILYGIVRIMTGSLAGSNSFSDVFGCIVAINVYELVLFAVLITIVAWKKVTDDAISLVVLVGLFIVAGGIVLGTGSYHAPRISSYIGLFCAGLGVVKLCVMRRVLLFRIGNLSLIGMTWILLWNYLMSSVMAGMFAVSPGSYDAYREYWLFGWLVLLGGGVLILVEAIRSEVICGLDDLGKGVFLQSRSMTWVFMLIVLAGMGVHQYGIAYMYRVSHVLGDYVPLVVVICFLILELMRSTGKRFGRCEVLASLVPLVVMLYALFSRSVDSRLAFGAELLWYPPVILGLTGLGVLCICLHHGWYRLGYVGIGYGLGVLLTVGYCPDHPGQLNWYLFGVGVVFLLGIFGIVTKDIRLCFASAIVFTIGVMCTDFFAEFIKSQDMLLGTAAAGVMGLLTIIICLCFGKNAPRILTITASFGLAVFGFDYLGTRPGLSDLASLVVTTGLCWFLWIRTRDVASIPVLITPTIWKLYVAVRAISSWGFVLLSFLLLIGGAMVSLFVKESKGSEHVEGRS